MKIDKEKASMYIMLALGLTALAVAIFIIINYVNTN